MNLTSSVAVIQVPAHIGKELKGNKLREEEVLSNKSIILMEFISVVFFIITFELAANVDATIETLINDERKDVIILDQSVFFGVADIHDRHRDKLLMLIMSYVELLALADQRGNVSTGLSSISVGNRILLDFSEEEYDDKVHLGTLECGSDGPEEPLEVKTEPDRLK